MRSFVVSGPSEVGVLPISKRPELVGKLPPADIPINRNNFWSTEEFFRYHYFNLVALFKAIVERSIIIEESNLESPLEPPDPSEKSMIFFPTRVTESMNVKAMRVAPPNIPAYFQRLRVPSKEE